MLLRPYLKDKPSAQVLGIGVACFSSAGLLTALSFWIESPPLLAGFAAVLAGVSIVINIHGLKRY